MSPIRVAVVDDSSFIRKAIARVLAADPRLEVVGKAASGEELLDRLETWRPQVVTLDLAMPGMGGLRTLDRLMAIQPLPVIILSTHAGRDAPLTIEALHRGAVDFIDKQMYSLLDIGALGAVLIEKILQVAPGGEGAPAAASAAPELPLEPPAAPEAAPTPPGDPLLLVGASTGGPPAIQTVLAALGPSFSSPVVVVQHMPPGFTAAFAQRLNAHLPLSVREAADGEPLAAATVHVAPAGREARIERRREGLTIRLEEGAREALHCPSVDGLFGSAARLEGVRAVAVLLTGMGSDGARGMAALAAAGAYTLAQDRCSSVVYGMPRAAAELKAVRESLALERIGPRVRELFEAGPLLLRSEAR